MTVFRRLFTPERPPPGDASARQSVADELVLYGRSLPVPETPDFAGRLEAQLRSERAPKPSRTRRRTLILAPAALLIVAGVTVAAVSPARSAFEEVFHIGGGNVRVIDRLPDLPTTRNLDLGRRVTVDQARRLVSFKVRLPGGPAPSSVYYTLNPPGGRISLVYGSVTAPRLLVDEFVTVTIKPSFEKTLGGYDKLDQFTLDGHPAIWIAGKHYFSFVDLYQVTRSETRRLAGNTLLWELDDATIRLEGKFSKQQAIAIARSMA